MAVESVFGGEVVWHSEINKAASKVLAHRFPGVPNLGSITDIDWAAVEPVDIICGGYPCQPFSHAGQREGVNDERHLWPYFALAIRRIRPRYAVLENVAGHRSMGFDSVLADLAEMRYDAQWCSVRASDVGAPHQRERLFVLASDASGPAVGMLAGRSSTEETGPHTSDRLGDHRGERSDVDLLPTPAAGNFNDGEDPETWLARRDAVKERLGNGNGMGMPLAIAVQLLPTPCARDENLSTKDNPSRQLHQADLPVIIARDLLPTPNAQDGNGGKAPRGGANTHNNGTKRQVPLTDLPDLLPTPTPTTQDASNCAGPSQFDRNTLPLNAEVTLLPTPSASDGVGGGPNNPNNRIAQGHHVQLLDMGMASAETWGKYAPAIARWEAVLGRPAPPPTEPNKNGNPRLSAAFSEWLMGWPDGWVTDPAIGISRNDQLRIVGNGVVSIQAEAALRYLLTVCEVSA